MINLEEHFKELLATWLRARLLIREDMDVVVRWYDEYTRTVADGYCETCYYEREEINVNIGYKVDGSLQEYDYQGNMSDLIRELSNI